MKTYLFGGMALLAIGLGAAAVYRGAPAVDQAAARAQQPAAPVIANTIDPATPAANAGVGDAIVKYLKPCNPPDCNGPDGQPLQRYRLIERTGDEACGPNCYAIEPVGSDEACPKGCYIIVDHSDADTQYRLTLPAGVQSLSDCNHPCAAIATPCTNPC